MYMMKIAYSLNIRCVFILMNKASDLKINIRKKEHSVGIYLYILKDL